MSAEVDVAGLRELLAAATPGPWDADEIDDLWTEEADGQPVLIAGRVEPHNSRLIAAAVNALPALLDLAERVRVVEGERDAANVHAIECERIGVKAIEERLMETARAESAKADLASLVAKVEALAIPLFDIVTKAVSPDDWARHLPNCGYTHDGPDCGCAEWGRRVLTDIRTMLAALLDGSAS